MSSHFKEVCIDCKIVVNQCRCDDENKKVISVRCGKCTGKRKKKNKKNRKPRRIRRPSVVGFKKTQPPKRKVKPVTLRYCQNDGPIRQGKFVWDQTEKAFVECVAGWDNIALYEEDGFKILGWK